MDGNPPTGHVCFVAFHQPKLALPAMALAGASQCSFSRFCADDGAPRLPAARPPAKRAYIWLPGFRPGSLTVAVPSHSASAGSYRRRARWSENRSEGALDTENGYGASTSGEEEEERGSKPGRGRPRLWLLVGAVVATGLVIMVAVGRGMFAGVEGIGSAAPAAAAADVQAPVHITWEFFGRKLDLGQRTPGWVYFCMLMAAGFGLFVSEEALNVWVGTALGRSLALDGSREALLRSLSENVGYITSTVLWVYWGVCISDMVPFYAGRLAARSGGRIHDKIGVSKQQVQKVMASVQRYGNLIGFVERFSLGVRNPTSFLAGAAGIAPERYFAGVCVGGLITLPLQLGVGIALREHPVRALATVASFVAAVSIFPYLAAGLASLAFMLRRQLGWSASPRS